MGVPVLSEAPGLLVLDTKGTAVHVEDAPELPENGLDRRKGWRGGSVVL